MFKHELSGTVTNQQGDIVAERIHRTDGNYNANMSLDNGKPARISCECEQSLAGFEEESKFAEAMLESYNKLRKSNYSIEEKKKEDNDYADRVFVSERDQPARMNIQIRHLDAEIIAGIGEHSEIDVERTKEDIVKSIYHAIAAKECVDPQLKAKTILQLIIPVPLGELNRQAIAETALDNKGFKEIWISPFREESFPLRSTAGSD